MVPMVAMGLRCGLGMRVAVRGAGNPLEMCLWEMKDEGLRLTCSPLAAVNYGTSLVWTLTSLGTGPPGPLPVLSCS